MHCHLLIPDLLAADAARDLRLPALETLLARSSQQVSPDAGMEAWLCHAFNINRQQDWPIAPITLAADGGNAGGGYWLRADPVHLRINRAQVILADSGTFVISQLEAEQLTDSLNRHFSADGILIYPLRPDRWYLKLAQTPVMHTHSLPAVAGKHIDAYLPQGADGMRWHAVFNEIQMLFHEHPVNQAREARGDLPINSIWLWGGGAKPDNPGSNFTQVWSRDYFSLALAQAAHIPHATLPQSAKEWLSEKSSGNGLLVIDSLRGAAQYGDILGWREAMQTLEQVWFEPLKVALKRRQIKQLTIHAVGTENTSVFTVLSHDLWKVWRRKKSLPHHLASS